MFDGTYAMFDKYGRGLGKVKKAEYEKIFNEFYTQNGPVLKEMLEYIAKSDDKDAAAKEVATITYDNLTQQYGKRGKLRRNMCIDLSIYQIYYLFTSIIKLEDAYSTLLCDALRDEWRIRSGNPQFSYTTYDEVHNGFKEKLFGFF